MRIFCVFVGALAHIGKSSSSESENITTAKSPGFPNSTHIAAESVDIGYISGRHVLVLCDINISLVSL